MLSIQNFNEVKISNSRNIRGGEATGAGSRSTYDANGNEHCFTYSSDCRYTLTSGNITYVSVKYNGVNSTNC